MCPLSVIFCLNVKPIFYHRFCKQDFRFKFKFVMIRLCMKFAEASGPYNMSRKKKEIYTSTVTFLPVFFAFLVKQSISSLLFSYSEPATCDYDEKLVVFGEWNNVFFSICFTFLCFCWIEEESNRMTKELPLLIKGRIVKGAPRKLRCFSSPLHSNFFRFDFLELRIFVSISTSCIFICLIWIATTIFWVNCHEITKKNSIFSPQNTTLVDTSFIHSAYSRESNVLTLPKYTWNLLQIIILPFPICFFNQLSFSRPSFSYSKLITERALAARLGKNVNESSTESLPG